MKHKLLTLFLVLAASIGITNAAIVNGTCGDNLTWSLNTKDSTLIIEGSGEMTEAPWSSYASYIAYVSFPDGLTNVYRFAFRNCSSITSVDIPNSVTGIGGYAFDDCSGLTSVTIGNSVTSIGESAFFGCSSLTSVTIPNSVTSIGNGAFMYCSSLEQITCEVVVPLNIDESAFEGVDKTIPLFVPAESVEAYANAIIWEEFTNIFAIGTIIGTYTVEFRDWDGTVLKTETVNHGSAAVAPEDPYREGYTFIGWDVDFNSVKEDLIVTAQYELGENKTFQISFNDKDNNIIIQNEVVLKVPAAPEIEGFTFLGWRPVANIIEYNYIEIEAVYQADGQSAAPEVFTNPANKAQKLIREGNVYILHEGKSYSVQGLEVK